MITLTSVTLPVASYSKFKPQQVDFLNITNPKAVLEKHLRSFACLSKNDMISIDYLGKEYELQIVETKENYQPVHAACYRPRWIRLGRFKDFDTSCVSTGLLGDTI